MKRNDTTTDEIELKELSIVTEQPTNKPIDKPTSVQPYITTTKIRFVVLGLISMVSLGW